MTKLGPSVGSFGGWGHKLILFHEIHENGCIMLLLLDRGHARLAAVLTRPFERDCEPLLSRAPHGAFVCNVRTALATCCAEGRAGKPNLRSTCPRVKLHTRRVRFLCSCSVVDACKCTAKRRRAKCLLVAVTLHAWPCVLGLFFWRLLTIFRAIKESPLAPQLPADKKRKIGAADEIEY